MISGTVLLQGYDPEMAAQQWCIDAGTTTMAKLATGLRRFFRSRINNSWDVEELVMQTWLAAGRNFEGRSSLRHYLYSIGKRLLSNYFRLKNHRPWIFGQVEDPATLEDDAPAMDVELALEADLERLNQAVSRLPAPYAAVLELTLRGHDHAAIAEILQINYNTVRSRYSRGKALLQQFLCDGPRDT